MTTDTRIAFEPGAQPGDRLTRNYAGVLIVVDVRPDGFLFKGRLYASLSKIAMSVTGVSTNGPLWFGLRRPGAKRAVARSQPVALPKMPPQARRPEPEPTTRYRRFWP